MKTNIDDKCNWRSCIAYLFIFIIPISLVIYCLCINNEDCFCEFDCKLGGDGCYPTCCRCPTFKNVENCLCCFDINHYCPNCRKLIGTRNAWVDICPSCCCSCENQNVLNLNDINNNNNINN